MKIEDRLNDDTMNQLKKQRKKNKVKKDPLKEKLSMSDLKDLMGMNRDRYERGRGGAMRRR